MPLPLTASFPQSASIVSRWKLNEASGTRADSVGSNTLTDNNTVLSAAGPACSETAADFERANSETLSITDASQSGLDLNGLTAISCSFWYKPESIPGTDEDHNLFGKFGATTAHQGYFLAYQDVSGTKRFRFFYRASATLFTEMFYNTTLSAGSTYHVAIAVDILNKAAKISLNGAAAASMTLGTNTATAIQNSTGDFAIGARFTGGGDYADGLIQDMILWNVKLTDAELDDIYGLACSTGVVPLRDDNVLRGVMRGMMRP